MEGLIYSNYKKTYEKKEINIEKEHSPNERTEKHFQESKRKIFQEISKKRLFKK